MARKQRQRPPLHQVDPTPSATNGNSKATSSVSSAAVTSSRATRTQSTSTVNTNARTSSSFSVTSSKIPSIPSSTTSIASIPSITSIESTTTITPSKDKSTKQRGFLALLGNGGDKSADRAQKKSASQQGKSSSAATPSGSEGGNGIDKGRFDTGPMLLPLLPSLDDFDLSLPFMNEFTSTTDASPLPTSFPTITSASTISTSSNSNNPTPPSFSTLSSFPPAKSQYLTSQSSRVQDYVGPSPSSTIRLRDYPSISNNNSSSNDRPPTMHSKTTIFSSTGTIHYQSPLDLSRLEASDYFGNKPLSPKGSDHTRIEDTTEVQRGRPQKPASDDLLSPPPRFVIRQPSITRDSKPSRPASPSPSLTPSVLSKESSPSVSHDHLHHAHSIQQPKQQQQQQSSSASVPETTPAASAKSVDAPSLVPPGSLTSSSSQLPETAAQKRSLSTTSSSISAASAPKKVTMTKHALEKGQPSPSASSTQNPNLRARISRLFRPNPKPERPSSLNQRYRNQQKQLYQESIRSASQQQQQQQEQGMQQDKQKQKQSSPAMSLSPPILILEHQKNSDRTQGGTRQVKCV
ncbi:hypothetical protein BGZ51_004417 [Haplosporangium sp. Z 767]|nr:hypothetical protein BGZ50_001768 [Haplosporangium sp. Z 11]KAF9192962.1 hypothetical protein BGZ51_004417 [Haplosporangium sp. Z 767]